MHHHKTYMYINFQQIGFVDQSKPCTQICSQKVTSCINLQLPIAIFKNQLFQTCLILKYTCISIFSKLGLVDQSNRAH